MEGPPGVLPFPSGEADLESTPCAFMVNGFNLMHSLQSKTKKQWKYLYAPRCHRELKKYTCPIAPATLAMDFGSTQILPWPLDLLPLLLVPNGKRRKVQKTPALRGCKADKSLSHPPSLML